MASGLDDLGIWGLVGDCFRYRGVFEWTGTEVMAWRYLGILIGIGIMYMYVVLYCTVHTTFLAGLVSKA